MADRAWPADKVERWPLDRLIGYARNAKTHPPEQVARIAASIREFGWTMPVLAVELNPAYVDVAVSRWCKFTGQKARRSRDGFEWDGVMDGG